MSEMVPGKEKKQESGPECDCPVSSSMDRTDISEPSPNFVVRSINVCSLGENKSLLSIITFSHLCILL